MTPYLWASGVKGEVGSRGQSTEVDLSFSDIVKHLDGALMLAGGRLWHMSAELNFTPGVLPGVLVDATERWIDPIVGMRTIADIGKRWRINGYRDIGGFGISADFTWQLLGTIGYQIGEGTVLRFGYRHLDVDFKNEKNGFIFDTGTSGWVLGATIRL